MTQRATQLVGLRVRPELLAQARAVLGMPDQATAPEVVRAALLKLIGHPDPVAASHETKAAKSGPGMPRAARRQQAATRAAERTSSEQEAGQAALTR